MNDTGKFLVSALLVHAANIKKLGDTQRAIAVPAQPAKDAGVVKPIDPKQQA